MDRSVYDTALSGAVVALRDDRGVVRVQGRDPVRMLHGLASNDVQALEPGRSVYATLLTPKGRMIGDPRIIRRADDLLLEADGTEIASILDMFKRSVPPLFARAEDASDSLCVVGVYGPASVEVVARALDDAASGRGRASASASVNGTLDGAASASVNGGGRVAARASISAGDDSGSGSAAGGDDPARAVLSAVAVDDSVSGSFDGGEVIVLRTDRAGVDGWEIVVACDRMDALRDALLGAGAAPCDPETLEVLRVEAGRPRWGAELTGDVIPLEAGLRERAISSSKGCYTGQEVIIRILHRGHVNRHLRGLVLSDPAAVGDELFHTDIRGGKSLGAITSTVSSPRLGEIALGYVRREVEPGTEIRVGSPTGPAARVVTLPFDIG
jgi:folate-binding protein YgfZ